MHTLNENATDDEIRASVAIWFTHIANGEFSIAEEFLDVAGANAVAVTEFVDTVQSKTNGGRVTKPLPSFDYDNNPVESWPVDGPLDLVYRWLPDPSSENQQSGFVAEVAYTIPVDGAWSDLNAVFYLRNTDGQLSLQLRGIAPNTGDGGTVG